MWVLQRGQAPLRLRGSRGAEPLVRVIGAKPLSKRHASAGFKGRQPLVRVIGAKPLSKRYASAGSKGRQPLFRVIGAKPLVWYRGFAPE